MEKPSLSYDMSSRFALHTREDSEKNERYYDRMTIRGIPVLRDQEGESTPAWRGDHSFSPDAATYSLMHFIEPEVSREHPEWTPAQVHENAVERFEKRLAQDLSYEHRESNHEESVVTWRPVETSRGTIELATEYGDKMVTLSELWSHTKEYAAFSGNPAAYNNAEHEAQLLMQDKLIYSSSNGFVSVLSHPDAVRYVQVWQKSDTGEIISQHVDLYAATGRDFSPEEAKDLIYHLSDFHASHSDTEKEQQENSYAHFFWREGSVNAEDVRIIAIAQSVYSSDRLYERETVMVSRRSPDIFGVVMTDVGNGMKQAGRFLAVEIEEKIRAIGSTVSRPETKRGTKPAGTGKEKRRSPVRLQVPQPGSQKKRENNTRSEFVALAHTGNEGLKSALAEWWISKTMVQYVRHLPAASHAMLYWFARIAERNTINQTPEKPFTPEPHLVSSAAREHDIFPKSSEMKGVSDVWKAFIDRIKRSVGLHAPSFRKERVTNTIHKKEHGNDTKRAVMVKPGDTGPEMPVIAAYYVAATLLSRFFEQLASPRKSKQLKEIAGIRARQEAKSEPMRERAVFLGRFMFALVVWWMYGTSPETILPKTAANTRTPKETNPDSETAEEKNPSESPVWILLSIIWKLAMIRESAMAGVLVPAKNQQTSMRPKRKRKHAALPQHGIIFAFAS